MKGGFDRSKSLQEIEQHNWGEPTFDSSLVTTCHRLRRKPLNEFTVEDLRIMIGQQISLPILMPLAVERLESEPLAEGNHYPGDLLAMVLKVDEKFWAEHADSFQRVSRVVERVTDTLSSLDEITKVTVQRLLNEATRSFASCDGERFLPPLTSS